MSFSLNSDLFNFTARELDLVQKIATVCEAIDYSQDHRNSIGHWRMCGFEHINAHLRGMSNVLRELERNFYDPKLSAKQAKRLLDVPTAALPQKITVWRGAKTYSENMPSVGDIYTDKGFQATSLRRYVALEHAKTRGSLWEKEHKDKLKPVILKMQLPKDHPIVPVWYIIHTRERRMCDTLATNELELLLRPGSWLVHKVMERKLYTELTLTPHS